MKRTQDEAEKIFKDHGFILKDIYKNTSTPLFCIDMYGYKYANALIHVSGVSKFESHTSPYK